MSINHDPWEVPTTDPWEGTSPVSDTQPPAEQPQDPTASFQEVSALANSPHPVWDALQVPSQMASRGLNAIAEAVPGYEPTGKYAHVPDVALNIPKVAAETLAQAAPGFIDRTSLLLSGGAKALQAARPIGSAVGQWGAGQLEEATKSVPGSLKRAWNDASLIFAKGKQAASPLYEAGKTGGKTAENLRKIPLKEDFLDVASKLADEGKLPAEIALEGRKMAGKLLSKGGGKYTEDFLRGLVDKFSSIAKSNENISAGDQTFKRGLDAASLRRLVPKSTVKLGMMGWLANTLGPAGAGLLSPAVHGGIATAGGLAAKVATNPAAMVTARQALITQFIENRSQGSR